MLALATAPAHRALVARNDRVHDHELYLLMTPEGRPAWVNDPETATPFETLREATRMATRLPASAQAYGVPLDAQLMAHVAH
ncbi:MAG: hypothetical protein U1E50_19295 [Caulobacteraceae bacterium]